MQLAKKHIVCPLFDITHDSGTASSIRKKKALCAQSLTSLFTHDSATASSSDMMLSALKLLPKNRISNHADSK
jgi:hypothetical protein